MRFCEKLYLQRKLHNMSQAELAEALNVSRQAISKWETGSAVPGIDNLLAISRLYGVSIDYLADDNIVDDKSVPEEVSEVKENPINRHLYWWYLAGFTVIGALIIAGLSGNMLVTVTMSILLAAGATMILLTVHLCVKKACKNRPVRSLKRKKKETEESFNEEDNY